MKDRKNEVLNYFYKNIGTNKTIKIPGHYVCIWRNPEVTFCTKKLEFITNQTFSLYYTWESNMDDGGLVYLKRKKNKLEYIEGDIDSTDRVVIRLLDKLYESIQLEKQLEKELNNNNNKKEKRLKI